MARACTLAITFWAWVNTNMKLTAKQVKAVREQLLKDQGGCCAMCKLPCSIEDAVLDHDHKTGYVRGTAHRACNALEGKIVNAALRFGAVSLEALLVNLATYHKLHAEPQTEYIYPTHRTAAERATLAKKRRQRKAKTNGK